MIIDLSHKSPRLIYCTTLRATSVKEQRCGRVKSLRYSFSNVLLLFSLEHPSPNVYILCIEIRNVAYFVCVCDCVFADVISFLFEGFILLEEHCVSGLSVTFT